jgi:hypothetical protein
MKERMTIMQSLHDDKCKVINDNSDIYSSWKCQLGFHKFAQISEPPERKNMRVQPASPDASMNPPWAIYFTPISDRHKENGQTSKQGLSLPRWRKNLSIVNCRRKVSTFSLRYFGDLDRFLMFGDHPRFVPRSTFSQSYVLDS